MICIQTCTLTMIPVAFHRLLDEQVRGRLYIGYKKWIFWGDEHWFVGHPSLVAHVFGPRTSKYWSKLDQPNTLRALYDYRFEMCPPDKGIHCFGMLTPQTDPKLGHSPAIHCAARTPILDHAPCAPHSTHGCNEKLLEQSGF